MKTILLTTIIVWLSLLLIGQDKKPNEWLTELNKTQATEMDALMEKNAEKLAEHTAKRPADSETDAFKEWKNKEPALQQKNKDDVFLLQTCHKEQDKACKAVTAKINALEKAQLLQLKKFKQNQAPALQQKNKELVTERNTCGLKTNTSDYKKLVRNLHSQLEAFKKEQTAALIAEDKRLEAELKNFIEQQRSDLKTMYVSIAAQHALPDGYSQ